MISSLGVVLAIGFSLFLLTWLLYPKLEKQFDAVWTSYLVDLEAIARKMYWQITRKQIHFIMALPTLLFFGLGYFLSAGFGAITVIFSSLLGFIGWMTPKVLFQMLWQQRLRKFDNQLIDGLNLLANSLKSGLNLDQAISVLVREMSKPLAQEFSAVLSQKQLGLTLDEALEKMLDRVPSQDLSVAIHSVLILRETGGNLSETFDVIANTIRERRKVDGKIESLTAQGKMQGLILFCMPFGFGLFLYLNNPSYLQPMFTTTLGWMIILAALVLQIIGILWVKQIVKIEV